MVALIAKLDGSHGLLFHMEQRNNETGVWCFRVRWPESSALSLRAWQRERSVTGRSAFFGLADPGSRVEVEWRNAEESGWQQAVPHECIETTAPFSVLVKERRDWREGDRELRVSALVNGLLAVFDLEMPQRLVACSGPEVVEVEGRSYHFGPGHWLEEAEAFQCGNRAFAVANSGPGQAALRPVPLALPGMNEARHVCFVKAGRISEEELERLRQAHA